MFISIFGYYLTYFTCKDTAVSLQLGP